MNSRRSKRARKAWNLELESETVTSGASPIDVSLLAGIRELSTLWMIWRGPCLRFSNLDVRSISHSYLRNYELRTLNTYISTCKSRQNSKGERIEEEM